MDTRPGAGQGHRVKQVNTHFGTSSFVANIVMHVQEIIVHRPKLSHTQVHYPYFVDSMNTYLIFQSSVHAVGGAAGGLQVQIQNYF